MSNDFRISQLYEWNEHSKKMFSRFSAYELCKIVKDSIVESRYLSIPQLPMIVQNLTDLQHIESKMNIPLLLKTPWSAAGKGLFKTRDRNDKSVENQWVTAKLKEQKSLFVEPFLRKIQDVSFHFYKKGTHVTFLGVNFFKTEHNGTFKGCYLNFYNHPDYNPEIIQKEAIDEAKHTLWSSLQYLKTIEHYDGYIGIDALFFYDTHDKIKLHPAIEINLRKTMGLINLQIETRVSSDSYGFWEIMPMKTYAPHTTVENTVKDGKLQSGIFPLSPTDMGGSVVIVLQLET